MSTEMNSTDYSALYRQERIRFLQSQINNHFLYTTLESMRGMMAMGKTDAVRSSLTQMATIYRYCSETAIQVPLSDEIRITELIQKAGIPAERVKKLYEGRPNIIDLITNGKIQLIINSPVGKDSIHDDSYLRKNAIKARVPYITTIDAARAAAEGIRYVKKHGDSEIRSLQEWHSMIK